MSVTHSSEFRGFWFNAVAVKRTNWIAATIEFGFIVLSLVVVVLVVESWLRREDDLQKPPPLSPRQFPQRSLGSFFLPLDFPPLESS